MLPEILPEYSFALALAPIVIEAPPENFKSPPDETPAAVDWLALSIRAVVLVFCVFMFWLTDKSPVNVDIAIVPVV